MGRHRRCRRLDRSLRDRPERRSVPLPVGDLGINVAGALLLGFFLTVALGHLPMSVMTPIAVGLIGGFTTFSTFTWEAFTLGRTGRSEVALLYVTVSICCGLVAAWAGYTAGRALH